ncbi:MAG: hypothetical protein NTZ93_02335 [Candidatus Beckwithbacteria bacterium]|nr:hypothetical protein [Candidatus Beckwithbacteria bacterium]
MKNLFISLILISLAIGERLWFDLGPNVELIMTTSVLASIYLGRRWGVVVALLSLMISDLVIGNTMIMIFTWSAFSLIAFGGRWLKNKAFLFGAGYGLAGALFFYFYTNFGVWLIGGLYPHTLFGLIDCYVMGLPFLKLQAVSSMVFLGGTLGIINLLNLRFWVSRCPRSA